MNEDAFCLLLLAEELGAFVQDAVPGTTSVEKYGGTLFTLKPDEKEGQFCGVFIYKQHVQLSFSKGAHLKDKTNLLSGSGRLRRHINLRSLTDVDCRSLKTLLISASKL